ncbi:hypothetical protein [Bacillus cereus]|uniref:hypothetical protein n=1 Tax=Bacillus cereus TaxID=1396 RepID=UPI00119FE4C2|nr:hypothetical protein [Bacillus cereus]
MLDTIGVGWLSLSRRVGCSVVASVGLTDWATVELNPAVTIAINTRTATIALYSLLMVSVPPFH